MVAQHSHTGVRTDAQPLEAMPDSGGLVSRFATASPGHPLVHTNYPPCPRRATADTFGRGRPAAATVPAAAWHLSPAGPDARHGDEPQVSECLGITHLTQGEVAGDVLGSVRRLLGDRHGGLLVRRLTPGEPALRALLRPSLAWKCGRPGPCDRPAARCGRKGCEDIPRFLHVAPDGLTPVETTGDYPDMLDAQAALFLQCEHASHHGHGQRTLADREFNVC
jgi:hypothetical protein